MINLKKLLLEDTLANLAQNIKVVVKVDRTNHAKERQSRHGFEEDEYISDEEIIITAKRAIDKISKMLLFNYIDLGDSIVIKNTKTDLNLVCALENDKNSKIDLVVITVMRKKDFKTKGGTKIIYI